jgi:hypothetical protein
LLPLAAAILVHPVGTAIAALAAVFTTPTKRFPTVEAVDDDPTAAVLLDAPVNPFNGPVTDPPPPDPATAKVATAVIVFVALAIKVEVAKSLAGAVS